MIKPINEAEKSEIARLKKEIESADAILIGAGAGLSTSAGFTYTGERLEKWFGDFVHAYNIPDMYSGGFIAMQMVPEIMWAYWAKDRSIIIDGDTGEVLRAIHRM